MTTKTFEYARNHQLPITLTADRARKFLGNVEDPQQCEAEELLGVEIILSPKPFPEAMAYSIVVNEDIMYEYILLQTKEILDDGTSIISNEEQKSPLYMCLKANPKTKEAIFTFKFNGGNTLDLLHYRQFLRKAEQGGHMIIHHLESGRNLFEGTINLKKSHRDCTASFDDEIDFLKKVIIIEEYFHESIDIPEQLLDDDVEAINYISAIVQGLEVSGGWSRYELNLTIGTQTKEKILSCTDIPYSLTYIGSVTASVFGKSYTLPCQRTLTSVVLMDVEKVRNKLDILEEGDNIKLIYLPGTNDGKGVFVDRLPLSDNE